MNYNNCSLRDMETIAQAFAGSGLYPDARAANVALVKILLGRDLGLTPHEALSGVQIVQGKATLSATTQTILVKRSGKYDYRVIEHDERVCRLSWYQAGEPVGESCYTIEDATRAGLAGKDIWKKYPTDLLFARALTQGVRRYAPDALSGVIYAPEEIESIPPRAEHTPLPLTSPQVMQTRQIVGEIIDEGRQLTAPAPDNTQAVRTIKLLAGVVDHESPHLPVVALLEDMTGKKSRAPEKVFDALKKMPAQTLQEVAGMLDYQVSIKYAQMLQTLPTDGFAALHAGICADLEIDASDPKDMPLEQRAMYYDALARVTREVV